MIRDMLKFLRLDLIMRPIMPLGGWYLRVSPRMISCREFNDFVYDYVEGDLTDKQLKLFERHMRVCPMCRQYLKTYIASYKASTSILPYEDIELPASVPNELIKAIKAVKKDG